jgi:anti-anti-sigma factor
MATSKSSDAFTIERHGDVTLIAATPSLETLDASLEEQVADVLLGQVRVRDNPLIVFDLSDVSYFGSMFVAVLLRCWKRVTAQGGNIALSGVSDHARELLRMTSLDMIFPIYPTRREAIDALQSD